LTVGTNSEKIEPVRGYHVAARGLGFLLAVVLGGQVDVLHLAATLAYYMIVRSGVGVKTVEGAARTEHPHEVLLRKYGQIPVHRAGAEIGKCGLQPVIEP